MQRLCALSTFALVVLAGFRVITADDKSDITLFQELTSKDEATRTDALAKALQSSEQLSPLLLCGAAHAALQEKRLVDAALLYYAGQFRQECDRQILKQPDKQQHTALAAINFQVGASLNMLIVRDPEAYAQTVARLERWTPSYAENQAKSLTSVKVKAADQRTEIVAAQRAEMLKTLKPMSELLQNPRYALAIKILQARNLDLPPNKNLLAVGKPEQWMFNITEDEYQWALDVGKEMEHEHGVKLAFHEAAKAEESGEFRLVDPDEQESSQESR